MQTLEERNEKQKEYYKKHREYYLKYQKEHRERGNELNREYRKRQKEGTEKTRLQKIKMYEEKIKKINEILETKNLFDCRKIQEIKKVLND